MDKEVLTLVLKEIQKAFGNTEEHQGELLIDLMKTYLQEHVYGTMCLQDVCAYFNLSKSYLCELFRKETGQGIIDYYTELKIQEAKKLIQRGDLNLSQIAEMLQYASVHQFSRSFKNRVGMSPSAYKNIERMKQ